MNKRKKLNVAVIMGGKSAEHEVSLQSAKNIIATLDKKKYNVIPIGIDKRGAWHMIDSENYFLHENDPKNIAMSNERHEVIVKTDDTKTALLPLSDVDKKKRIDVVFPVIHGTYGEDGTLQGLLEMMDVAYVGPDVAGSAIGMDKDIAKRLLRDAGIAVAPFITLHTHDKIPSFAHIKRTFGTPFFVKPANAGSSVGISQVNNIKGYTEALKDAFCYDTKILIEKAIIGRELECAVLGNENPRASTIGEVVPTGHDFYSYEAKYIDENGASIEIPAKLPSITLKKLQKTACHAFQTLACEGMARVDFFLTKSGKIYINEINTIPGFTKISMYPKLWEVSDLPYAKLLDELIRLAIARHKRKKKLKITFSK